MPEDRPPSIVLVGEALVDVFPDREVVGGAPFNVARNLAALGAPVTMVTRVGDDAYGRRIADEYARFGIDPVGLQLDATRRTGLVHVESERDGHRLRVAPDVAWDALDATSALDATHRVSPQAIYFGMLAQRSVTSRDAILRCVAEQTEAPRFLDLNLRVDGDDENLSAAIAADFVSASLALADVVKVNTDELAALLAWFVTGLPDGAAIAHSDARSSAGRAVEQVAVRRLIERFALQCLVVTRGAEGCTAYDGHGERVADAGAVAVDVVDTVGAGDAFAAVLLLGLTHGWQVPLTVERASAFASAVCTLRGAVADDDAFYRVWRARWHLDCAANVLVSSP